MMIEGLFHGAGLTLSHLGDLIHSQPGGRGRMRQTSLSLTQVKQIWHGDSLS